MAPAPAGSSRSKALPKRTVAALRRQLEEERAQLLGQITRLERDFRDESWKEPRSDDDAEIGSNSFERERTMSLAQNARATVAEIDQALARIDAGTYGRCTECGQLIAAERLEARPQARLCLNCQRGAERHR
jgi:DnaK suppressor protein